MAAGDCPHHSQLQSTLKHCYDQTALLTASHENYLQFVDELKHDLESLSCQVSQVQQQFLELSDDDDDDVAEVDENERVAGNHEGAVAVTDAAGVVVDACALVPASLERARCGRKALRALESQNELLEQALEQMVLQKETTCSALEQNNESYKCQIEQLQRTICEKEGHINQLNTMLSNLTQLHAQQDTQPNDRQQQQEYELQDLRGELEQLKKRNETLLGDLRNSQKQERFLHCETRKLNDELIESKRKNNDANIQAHRLAALLKTQENHRMELSSKYEVMERNYEEQSKQLNAANAQMNGLQDRFELMEKHTNEHNMERNLLREEVLSLKEKEAHLLGKQRSIEEHLVTMEKELYNAHDVIKEQQCILQRNDFAHSEVVKRLQEATNDTKRQFNMVVEDYNKLQEEYEKQVDCRKQNEKVIDSFRKWKEAQLKSDEATRLSFKQYEEHIKLLLEEKQNFLEKYRELHRDYGIIQCELDRLKNCSFSTSAPIDINSDNSLTNRMEIIRRTSRRVSEQSSSLKDDECSPRSQVRFCPSSCAELQ